MVVAMDFYNVNEGRPGVPTKYVDDYSGISLLLKDTNRLEYAKPGTKNQVIQSGTYKYWVTPYSIRYLASDEKKPVYLADVRHALKETCYTDRKNMEGEYYAEETYTPLSAVGPYVTAQYFESMYMGGAHPSAYTSFETRDVRKVTEKDSATIVAAEKFNLFQISSEQDILAALKGDKFLQKKVGSRLASATSTTAAHKMMHDKMSDDCDINIPASKEEAFSQLAIFDYDQKTNKMQVRVGFSYGCEAARGNFTQLGLVLRPTPEFTTMLSEELASAAAQGRKPYFMRYAQQLK